MAKLNKRQIQDLAKSIIKASQGGIRYSDLVRRIQEAGAETPVNTIHGSVWNLASEFPVEIAKPSRGLFVSADSTLVPSSAMTTAPGVVTPAKTREEDYYEPFAEWLKNELDEATIAIPLGGSGLQKKWGTPDVIGVYKPRASDRIKSNIEIIAAEIKTDPLYPVVAFGQAAAYRLFASKAYVVMPRTVSEEDYARLEALCILFGIGLVLFDLDKNKPDFTIRVRAQRFLPDMFYVNEFADRLHQIDGSAFEVLFG